MAKKLSELKPSDEVVATLSARKTVKDGEDVILDPEKNVVMTFAGFQAIELRTKTEPKEGELVTEGYAPAMDRKVKLVGTPKYGKEEDTLAGKVKTLEGFDKFGAEKATE